MSGAGAGPMRQVMDALRAGHTGRRALCDRTGLSPGMVDAALAQLERLGLLEREEVGSACPTGGCGSCASSSTCAGAGRGPVFLTLTRRAG